MELYFGGTEIPSHRKLLAEQGVSHVSLSYMGLRRRTKFTRPFILAEKYPDDQKIFLDSGAYTVNRDETSSYTKDDLFAISAAYLAFVQENLPRLEMVSEFDVQILGQDWIEAQREDFYDDLPDGLFLPIWHLESGIDELDKLAQRYDRVGIPQTTLSGRDLAPTLNSIVQKYGTRLHGIAMTKPDVMASIKFDSVASTSWLSPSQFGDTIIWTGNELKRYPVKYKERARKQHRTYLIDKGFDAAAIEADDTAEVLKLSIWSWQQQIANLDRRKLHLVTNNAKTPADSNTETPGGEVATFPDQTRNSQVAIRERDSDERVLLPIIGMGSYTDRYTDESGVRKERQAPILHTRSQSMRICDTCFLRDKCPKFEPGANCAYDIPIEIKTKEQLKALQEALVEMQAQRVLFMRMAEDMEGGYADPNLSNEVDRLQRIIDRKDEMEKEGFSLKIEAKQRGEAGMISRLFGRDAGEQAQALPAPISVESVAEYMDAELVDPSDR